MKFTFSNLPATGWTLPAGRIVDLARLAEEVGFDRFAVADLPYHYDCMTVMTACLLGTSRLEVESLVTNPYTRDPGLIAATFATLADLSGGRAILGIGGGVETSPSSPSCRSEPRKPMPSSRFKPKPNSGLTRSACIRTSWAATSSSCWAGCRACCRAGQW